MLREQEEKDAVVHELTTPPDVGKYSARSIDSVNTRNVMLLYKTK